MLSLPPRPRMSGFALHSRISPRMKSSVQISRGIESLFGTRDENIRLIESGLNVRTRLLNDSLEIEGDEAELWPAPPASWTITWRWCAKATSSTTAI